MSSAPHATAHRFAKALALTVSLGVSTAGHAALTVEVSSTCIDSLGGIEEINPATSSGSTRCNFVSSNVEHTASGSAVTTVKSGPRRVGIDSKATASLTRVHDYMPAATIVQTSGRVTLVDRFDVVARDIHGNPVSSGYMDVDVLASGVVSLSGTGGGLSGFSSSQLRYRFEMTPGRQVEGRTVVNYEASESVDALLSERWYWEDGVPISLTLEVEASTNAFMTATGSAESRVDFGNSLDWLGVRNVTDTNGVVVASFSIISPDTGIDWGVYTPPVPEPQTLGLLLAGLGIVGWTARRRARSRPAG